MPTKKTVEYVLFKFDELSDKAKEKARDWWKDRQNRSGDNFWSECVIEDAKQCAERMGIEISDIYWSGFSSQGDGACFEGSWEWPKGQTESYEKRIKDHAPLDEKLHQIAITLDDLQQRHANQLRAVVKHSGYYSHSGCTDIDVSKIDDEGEEQDYDNETYVEVVVVLRSFMDWIYQQLETSYWDMMSDEQVDEAILVNDYDFFEDGRRATV